MGSLATVREKTFTYFKDSYSELRRVVWPTRAEVSNHTLIVIALSIFIAAFLGALDVVFTSGIEKFLFLVK